MGQMEIDGPLASWKEGKDLKICCDEVVGALFASALGTFCVVDRPVTSKTFSFSLLLSQWRQKREILDGN